ncbi:MAG: molybdopterin synthase sulfur carrier subunit [Parashewanella sp.]
MIKVLFFAQVRELIGTSELLVEAAQQTQTTDSLRQHLIEQNPKWESALASEKLLVAVNQEFCDWQAQLTSGDEVAFFPPVTGG